MRFLLDMGISAGAVAFLRNAGHDAEHLQDLGLGKLSDSEILAYALRERRTVITHDLDFANLLAASSSRLPSVIIFRLRNMRPDRVIQRLHALLTRHAADLEKGVVLSVSELQIRLRRLPLDSSSNAG
jgi:predicted nuclease of predicted toxin-antitoxin system